MILVKRELAAVSITKGAFLLPELIHDSEVWQERRVRCVCRKVAKRRADGVRYRSGYTGRPSISTTGVSSPMVPLVKTYRYYDVKKKEVMANIVI
jgi:hypothetical protein